MKGSKVKGSFFSSPASPILFPCLAYSLHLFAFTSTETRSPVLFLLLLLLLCYNAKSCIKFVLYKGALHKDTLVTLRIVQTMDANIWTRVHAAGILGCNQNKLHSVRFPRCINQHTHTNSTVHCIHKHIKLIQAMSHREREC